MINLSFHWDLQRVFIKWKAVWVNETKWLNEHVLLHPQNSSEKACCLFFFEPSAPNGMKPPTPWIRFSECSCQMLRNVVVVGSFLFTSWRMEVLTKEQLLVRRWRELMNFYWHLTCRSLQVCTCVYLKEVDLRISFVNDFTKPSPWFIYSINDFSRGPNHFIYHPFPQKTSRHPSPPIFPRIIGRKRTTSMNLVFFEKKKSQAEESWRFGNISGLEKRDALDTLEGAPSLETCDFWDPAKGWWFCWFLPWGYLLQTTEFPKKCSPKIVDWFDKIVEVRYS